MTETEMYKLLKAIKKTNKQPYLDYDELRKAYKQCPPIEQLQEFCAYTNYLESPTPTHSSYRLTPLGEIFLSSFNKNMILIINSFIAIAIALVTAIITLIC